MEDCKNHPGRVHPIQRIGVYYICGRWAYLCMWFSRATGGHQGLYHSPIHSFQARSFCWTEKCVSQSVWGQWSQQPSCLYVFHCWGHTVHETAQLVSWLLGSVLRLAWSALSTSSFLSSCLRPPRAGIARVPSPYPTHPKALFGAHAACVMVGRRILETHRKPSNPGNLFPLRFQWL